MNKIDRINKIVDRSSSRFILIILLICLIFHLDSYSQQLNCNTGAYIKNNAANIVVNGSVVNAGAFSNTGSGTIKLTNAWINNGTYTPATDTVFFLGSATQEISGTSVTTFHHLFINNPGGVAAGKNIAVNGNLDLLSSNPSSSLGTLEMGTDTLKMGGSAITTGSGDVTGIVGRSVFIAGVPYSFGNSYTTVTFSSGGTLPTDMKVRINIGTAPSWKTNAIERNYDIVRTGGSGNTVDMAMHYLDSELNSNPEDELYIWDYHANTTPRRLETLPKSAGNTTNDWVSTSNLDISYLGTTFNDHMWSLAQSVYVTFEGTRGWRMVSSPTMTTYGGLLQNFITQGMTGSTYPAKQPNFLWFDETDTLTTNMSWRNTSSLANTTIPGRGFYFYVFDSVSGANCDTLPRRMNATGNAYFPAGTFTFTGVNHPVTSTARTGIQTQQNPNDTIYYDINVADQGWNLVGNPSESTLDWDASGWTKTNLDNSIYIWDPADSEFKVWNGYIGTLGSGLIHPFQAFWVKASATSPVLSFTSDVLTTGGSFYGGGAKKKSLQTGPRPLAVDLSLLGAGMQGNAMISFMDNGTIGPDAQDAYRLEPLSDSWMELFTLSSPAHALPLVINNLPLDGPDVIVLPLFTGEQQNGRSVGGNFTLQWALPPDWPADWAISLHDHNSKTAISMRHQQSYDFTRSDNKSTSASGNAIDGVPALPPSILNPVARESMLKSASAVSPFSIIIQKHSDTNDPVYMAQQPTLLQNYPNPFCNSTTLRFSLPVATMVNIRICDIYGVLIDVVANQYFEAGIHSLTWQARDAKPGIYLACMQTNDMKGVIKLIKTTF